MRFEPRLLAFLCQWCSYRGADAAGRQRHQVPWTLRTVCVPCSGRVTGEHVLRALHRGADGVLVLACHAGDCHYQQGNVRARRAMQWLGQVLEQTGVGAERLCFEHVSATEGARFAAVVEQFAGRVEALGPLLERQEAQGTDGNG